VTAGIRQRGANGDGALAGPVVLGPERLQFVGVIQLGEPGIDSSGVSAVSVDFLPFSL
jgi:hypothetical protein